MRIAATDFHMEAVSADLSDIMCDMPAADQAKALDVTGAHGDTIA